MTGRKKVSRVAEEHLAMDLGYMARVRKVAETTIRGKRILIQEMLPFFGDFQEAGFIQAKEVGTNRLVAYAGLQTEHSIREAKPNWIELRQIKVLSQYRKEGFGNAFLALICHLAAKSKVPLVLKPEPTGEKPLSKKRLTEWYKKHGFRELSPQEIEKFAHQKLMYSINLDLIFSGFDHKTGKLTGPKRYSAAPKEIQAMNAVPEATRIELYRQKLIKDYGHDGAYRTNLEVDRRLVSGRLVREPSKPVHPQMLKRFKLSTRYHFPNRTRIRRAWEAIHRAGKEPRKRPKAHRITRI